MEEQTENQQQDVRSELKYGMSKHTSKYIIAVVAVLMMLAIWFGKSQEVKHVREEAAADSLLLRGEATRQVVQSHEEHLRLLAKPLVWAIRAEMMQNNIRQLKFYMDEMVEKTDIQNILVVDKKAHIIASTRRNDEGKPYSTIGKRTDLVRADVVLENVGDKTIILRSPITGPGGRIGTLIIHYTVKPIQFH